MGYEALETRRNRQHVSASSIVCVLVVRSDKASVASVSFGPSSKLHKVTNQSTRTMFHRILRIT